MRKEENVDVEENLTVSALCNWMDHISIAKFKYHRKNNKMWRILNDKRKGSKLSLQECQLPG